TVDPDECWINTSGGFEDEQPIPIGAGVGATSSGDFGSPPAAEPLSADGESNPCMAGSVTYVSFSPSEFPFVTTLPDDGTGDGGGFQVAKANLEFKRTSTGSVWYCGITIGMPLRNHHYGKISASRAADISVDVTEEAAAKMKYDLPPGTFCIMFVPAVEAAFQSMYPKLGQVVK
ncbi:MAG TPA: hypothetical protein VM694_00420, partial [Polyangium sp.]|nr:hypothetical protein [Polyangium sp.]